MAGLVPAIPLGDARHCPLCRDARHKAGHDGGKRTGQLKAESTMKRLHVHVAVDDLSRSIGFYSALFAAQPSVTKPDYAKWMLDDPRVNFAISTRGREPGLDHLGIQA